MLAAGLSLTPAVISISRGAFLWPRITTGAARVDQDRALLGSIGDALRAAPGVASVSNPQVSSDGSAARFRLVLRAEPSTRWSGTAVP